MKDLEYQTRFVNCFMNHYNHQYELHVFTNMEQLLETKSKDYTVIITGEYSIDEVTKFVERGEILLFLAEDSGSPFPFLKEEIVCIQKYQEVYKIEEVLKRVVAEHIDGYQMDGTKSEYKSIGVFSLTKELYQAPFAALLAKVYAEHEKVIVIDLQAYSGLCRMEEGMTSMGMEDLLSSVITGNYSRSRIMECIRHEADWDYICAVQNMECLAEGTKDSYDTIMEILAKELGYQTIILNFGAFFVGQAELMEKCQRVYFLCENEHFQNWREDAFFQILLRQEKRDFIQRIQKISIASGPEKTWQDFADKWMWSSLGDEIRRGAEREFRNGAAM